jgi:hypothetical protein
LVPAPGGTCHVKWENDHATEVALNLLQAVIDGEPIWRGEMLSCKDVQTETLPRDMVRRVLSQIGIEDPAVDEQGLSLFFPGGQSAFEQAAGELPYLVMGVSKSNSGPDPCSLGYSSAACCGASGPGRMPPVSIMIISSLISYIYIYISSMYIFESGQ